MDCLGFSFGADLASRLRLYLAAAPGTQNAIATERSSSMLVTTSDDGDRAARRAGRDVGIRKLWVIEHSFNGCQHLVGTC